MFALIRDLSGALGWADNPLLWLVVVAFQLWMLIDAVRRGEWIWVACIVFFSVLSAVFYYFMVYRQQGPAGGGVGLRGFELPGAADRRRIKELLGRIHHLDKARDHSDLADIYFSQGKMAKAEAEYRLALERDPEDIDTRSHFGQCLLRQGRAEESLPVLESVIREDPRHDFGFTMMALAEAQTLVGRKSDAAASWRKVLETNSYPRARVQYAELLAETGDREGARREVDEVIEDEKHAVSFQKSRDKVWVSRAKKLRGRLS
jgi:hypothetical protein